MTYTLTVLPSERQPRILLTQGSDELLRAVLPPLKQIRHERAVKTLFEALSLWLDGELCVAWCAAVPETSFSFDVTDELGNPRSSVFYEVRVVPPRIRRPRRLRGVGDFAERAPAPAGPRRRRERLLTAPLETEAEIRRLYFAEHWPVGTIAAQLHVHEDVVRRVTGLSSAERFVAGRPRLVAPFEDFIDETLTAYPTLRATRLYDMLRARGFPGSVRTLREHVALVRPVPKREAFLRLAPLIGEQGQIDWAHVGEVKVPGGTRPLWLFVMVLSWSRALWGEFIFDLSAHSLLRSLSRAAAFFGGSPRQWLFDNPKIVVLERHGGAARFHPLLLDLAGHYRVSPRLCGVRKANEKGRVERSIRYLRDRFLAGRTVDAIDKGNRDLALFLSEIAHPRPHPTLPGRTVADCFAEERTRLLPLPERPAPIDLVQPAVVDKTAFLRFDRNAYSVPSTYAEKTVTLCADDRTLRVLDGAKEIARHARCWGRRQTVEAAEHRAELWQRKHAAHEGQGQGRLRSAAPSIDRLFERWVAAGRNVGSLTAQALKLLELYGPEIFAAATDELLTRGTHDPGALAVLCDQRRRALLRPVPIDVELGAHVPDKEVIPHPLENYDAKRRRRD